MAQPFVGQGGTIRLSPLERAVANQKTVDGSGNPAATVTSVNTAGGNGTLPEGVTEDQVAEAAALAEGGDQAAIDWLKSLGIVTATAAAGYATYKLLSGRKKKQFGAEDISEASAAKKPGTAVVPKTRPVDLYVDRPGMQPQPRPAGYIDAPYKVIGTGDPAPVTMDQMKTLTEPGPRYPVGPTKQQMDADMAYQQKAIQDAIDARMKRPGAAKGRAFQYGDIIRNIRRLP